MRSNRIGLIPTMIQLAVFLILCSDSLSAQETATEFEVSVKSFDKELHQVLDDLTEQTGYFFTFDSRIIDSRSKINLTVSGWPLGRVLDSIFFNSPVEYQVINKNIVILPLIRSEPGTNDLLPEDSLQYKEVRGSVIDARNGKGLPYATIGIRNTHFGTVSNFNGKFVLRLSDTIQQPILAVSFIGYRNQYIPISIDSHEELEISLTKTHISLQEVVIRYKDPVSLLTESLKRIKENYMDQPAGAIGYYRERVQKDEKCMLFSEAVVEIDKASYGAIYDVERTRILMGRKITNIDVTDTVILKIKSGINTMLELDIVNRLPDFLSQDFILRYRFSFDDIVSFEDKMVYVIRFAPMETMNETLFRGKIYLERESLAIVAADFEYDPVRIGREQEMFVSRKSKRLNVRPLGANYHVEYKQSDQGYYLGQVHGEVFFKVRKRREWISSKYAIRLEMAITEINPGNPHGIKLNEKLKPNVIMSDHAFSYDPDFWGELNTIAPETSLEDALRKIEKSIQEISVKN